MEKALPYIKVVLKMARGFGKERCLNLSFDSFWWKARYRYR